MNNDYIDAEVKDGRAKATKESIFKKIARGFDKAINYIEDHAATLGTIAAGTIIVGFKAATIHIRNKEADTARMRVELDREKYKRRAQFNDDTE